MKFASIFLILMLAGCTNTIKVDSSFVQGCVQGAYVLASQLRLELRGHVVQASCMEMYLKRLEELNPKYKLESLEDKEEAI